MHGIDFKPGMDLTGYELTEKLDGARAEIRGGRMYTRSGFLILPPESWDLSPLPDCDGELYAGPASRAAVVAACNVLAFPWPPSIGLHLFDWSAPLPNPLPAGVRLVPQLGPARSTAHAMRAARDIIAAGGEGLMARAPGIPWTPGRARNSGLVKIKIDSVTEFFKDNPCL